MVVNTSFAQACLCPLQFLERDSSGTWTCWQGHIFARLLLCVCCPTLSIITMIFITTNEKLTKNVVNKNNNNSSNKNTCNRPYVVDNHGLSLAVEKLCGWEVPLCAWHIKTQNTESPLTCATCKQPTGHTTMYKEAYELYCTCKERSPASMYKEDM